MLALQVSVRTWEEPPLSGLLRDDAVHQTHGNKLLQSAQAFETNRAMTNYCVRGHQKDFGPWNLAKPVPGHRRGHVPPTY